MNADIEDAWAEFERSAKLYREAVERAFPLGAQVDASRRGSVRRGTVVGHSQDGLIIVRLPHGNTRRFHFTKVTVIERIEP